MGKRKIKDEDYYKKKLRRIEKKLMKMNDSNEEERSMRSPSFSPLQVSPRLPSPTLLPPTKEPSKSVSQAGDLDKDTVDDLPEELLEALGTEGEEKVETGEPIRPELAVRWSKILKTGLGKEARDMIIKKYPTPNNFPRSVAPILNPEISASLTETSHKRDRRIIYRQNLAGKIMNCLGKSLTKLLTGNINTKILVEELNDAAKLVAEISYQDSSSRRFFAMAGTNKTVQDALRTTTVDDFLFGTECADKIKAAQNIQKTSQTYKSQKKVTKPVNTSTIKKQENWRSSPQHQQRQARGGQKYQQNQRQKQRQVPQKARKPASSQSRHKYHR